MRKRKNSILVSIIAIMLIIHILMAIYLYNEPYRSLLEFIEEKEIPKHHKAIKDLYKLQ